MPVVTTSELLPQGGIDLLRGNKLISWVQGRETIATQIEFDGVTYTPAELDVTLERALRLPAGCEASSSIESQVREIAEILPGYGLNEDSALLGAAVSTATWAAECVGGMPIVNFFGPPGREVVLLNFIPQSFGVRCHCILHH